MSQSISDRGIYCPGNAFIRRFLLLSVLVFSGVLLNPAWAENFVRIENRWKPQEQINIQTGPPVSGPTQAGWWSADWVFEPVSNEPFVRIKNRWRNTYLHNQNGPVESGAIQPGWWSAQWQLEPVGPFYRIKNRWRGTYLHNQNGRLELGPVQPGWWSAMWTLRGYQPGVAATAPATRPAAPQAPAQPAQPAQPAAPATGNTTTPVMSNTAAQILGANTEPDICWKDSYGRGVGKLPDACPNGWERTGADLLCYPKCKAGFTGVGPVCWQDCPGNFRNDGAFCAKPAAYGRGAGFPWKFGDALNDSGMFQRCEASNGRGNCEKNGAIVYPKCKAGFDNVGCCVCSPNCPAGMTDIGVSCAKQSYGRGVGQGATCQAGMEQDFKGGLCYPQCKSGSSGVGPVCWSSCPSDFPVNCGAACGVDEAACAFAILEQVQSSAEVALNVGLLVTTAGAGNAGVKAAKLGSKSLQKGLTKQVKNQLRDQAEQQALNTRKWLQRQKNVKKAQDMAAWLEKPENVNTYAENMVDVYEKGEFDFTQLVPSAADFDPTGVLAVVNAFNKPICGR